MFPEWYELKKDYLKAYKLYWQDIHITDGLPKYISYEGLTRIALVNEKNPGEAKVLSEYALQKYPSDTLLLAFLASIKSHIW